MTDSSATSYTIDHLPLGALSFTTTQGNAFTSGQSVTIADSSSPTTRFITGVVTGYDKATSTVRVVVVTSQGQGTVSSWTISGTSGVSVDGHWYALQPYAIGGSLSIGTGAQLISSHSLTLFSSGKGTIASGVSIVA